MLVRYATGARLRSLTKMCHGHDLEDHHAIFHFGRANEAETSRKLGNEIALNLLRNGVDLTQATMTSNAMLRAVAKEKLDEVLDINAENIRLERSSASLPKPSRLSGQSKRPRMRREMAKARPKRKERSKPRQDTKPRSSL